jgi:hypothetical protein
LVINIVLFTSPYLGLVFAMVTGAIQMLHCFYLLLTIKQQKILVQLGFHFGTALVYLFFFYIHQFRGFTLFAIAIPVILAIYFWTITLQIYYAAKKNIIETDLTDFLQPTNNEA